MIFSKFFSYKEKTKRDILFVSLIAGLSFFYIYLFHIDDEYTLRMKANYTQTPLAKDITINPGVRFSGVWPMLSEMPYREHRDTACPLTPKDRFKKKLIKRWPDAIGIGFPKCGTGALGFIDCHSKFVFRESEPAFWNQPSRTMHGLRAYALPSASADEILIEKTPDYSKGSGTYLLHMAEQIKQNIPNVKLIVMLCDPATRAFSHIKHQTKDVGFSTKWSVNDPMEALRLLGRYMGTFNHPELIGTSPRLPVMQPIIDYGNYFTQLQPFFQVFDKSQFHFVDGGGIVTNPEAEFSKLESFFDVPNELMFKFNVTKGFPCLHRPVKMCLSAAKGMFKVCISPFTVYSGWDTTQHFISRVTFFDQ